MKSKYDWSNVPKEVKWIATDKTGWKGWFELEPKIELDMWLDDTESGFFEQFSESEFKGVWIESLEERPNEFN